MFAAYPGYVTIKVAKTGVHYQKTNTVEPGKHGGRPTIRSTRITVYDVLSYLAAGMTHEEILRDFPYLTEEDILACLAYAADRERRTLAAHGVRLLCSLKEACVL